MIKSISIKNYLGEILELDLTRPDKSGFAVLSIKGLGPAKADVNITDIVTNDGGLFNSSRLQKRNIKLKLQFYDTNLLSIEDIRLLSYKYFPIKKPLTFYITTDNREVQCTGYVETNEPDIFSKKEGCDISIICPDPYFYSVDGTGTTTSDFYGIDSFFEFHFTDWSLPGGFPARERPDGEIVVNDSVDDKLIEFGKIQIKTENVIYYNGDAEVGITISIHATGTVTNITIYNVGTRETMFIDTDKLAALTGSGFGSGDTITICTVRGRKSATLLRAGKTTNILNCLGRNNAWFTLAKGDNIFAFSAESGSLNLQFAIENQIVYEGV